MSTNVHIVASREQAGMGRYSLVCTCGRSFIKNRPQQLDRTYDEHVLAVIREQRAADKSAAGEQLAGEWF
jgi:hypothetical protein